MALEIIVYDSNILIDLSDIDLLDGLTNIGYKLHTNDFVISEIKNPLQLEKINKLVFENKLIVAKTEPNEYPEIIKLQCKNLSFEDCSIWYYAKKTNGILLTGDGNLRKMALDSGIEVKGILFVFDQLVLNKSISHTAAIEKLKQLQTINHRLPKEAIEQRIQAWENY
jgi:rRNA-processing protein FCF1